LIFNILTLFPETFSGYLDSSILGKVIDKGQIKINLINFRQFARDKHKTCDDMPFGGGPGMLLKPEPIAQAIESLDYKNKRIICLTASGRPYNQDYAAELSRQKELILICGHYEGIDQRIIDHYASDEINIGDYILFSGEVAAMVLIDSIVRLEEGIIRKESIQNESFSAGLLEYPQYTRPRDFLGLKVPEVLLSGNHADIARFRLKKQIERTLKNRPELLSKTELNQEGKKILKELIVKGEDNEPD
jgi:tRNA (guanine37-N1)-methyltransferase